MPNEVQPRRTITTFWSAVIIVFSYNYADSEPTDDKVLIMRVVLTCRTVQDKAEELAAVSVFRQ